VDGSSPRVPNLHVRWLGRIAYREAWGLQRRLAAQRAEDLIGDQLLLLEHDPVLTLGRNADESHVLAGPAELARRGIEVLRVERGGGLLRRASVAYPIVALERRSLLLRPFVRALEAAMIDTCRALGVAAGRREGHPGCWCDPDGPEPRKIGALGIRVERGVSYHGIALNVSVDLDDFGLIDPCGMVGLRSTSIALEAASRPPRRRRPTLPERVGPSRWHSPQGSTRNSRAICRLPSRLSMVSARCSRPLAR
jgi:lipoyl(octanoyl) transferase